MRVIFMGTPEFSVPVLDALVEAGHEIPVVYTQPPRPAGRGKRPRPTPVHARAEALGLAVSHPARLRDPLEQEAFAAHNADIAVVVAYGLILPQVVLDAPKLGCLNIHASLLPRWRGAAPIHRAIMAGDTQSGVCIMQMEAGLDTGPVLLRRATPISADDTTASLHDRLSRLGAEAMVQVLEDFHALTPDPQPDDGVTYAEKIDKSEAKLDWAATATHIDRKIRGLSPYPGAWTTVEGKRLKLLGSRMAVGNGDPGEVLADLRVACGDGAIEITRVQPEGKGAMDAKDWLLGARVAPGAILG